MKITLDIEDNRFKVFLNFVKTLDYVSVNTDVIPQCQKDKVARRIELIQKGEMPTRSWKEAQKAIFKK